MARLRPLFSRFRFAGRGPAGKAVLLALALCGCWLFPGRAAAEIAEAGVRAWRESPPAARPDTQPQPWTELLVTIEILHGDRVDEEYDITHYLYGHRAYDYVPAVGDRVIVALNEASGKMTGSILSRSYAEKTAGFLLALIVLFLALTRRAGLKALLALVVSLLLIGGLMFRLFQSGEAVFASGTAVIFLAVGVIGVLIFPKNTALPATAGVWAGLAAALLANLLFFRIAGISGLRTEPGQALHSLANNQLSRLTDADLTSLLLLGSLLAVSGIIIDIGAVLAAVIAEVRQNNPGLGRRALRRIGIDLGREIFSPLFNTLLLSYAGLALPFFGLCFYLHLPWLKVLNLQFIACAIVALVASGLGMLAAIYAVPCALTMPPAGGKLPAKALPFMLLAVFTLASLHLKSGAYELPEESELKVHPLLDATPGHAEYFPALVIAVHRDPTIAPAQEETVVLEGLWGDYRARTFTAMNYLTGNEHRDIPCSPGSYVLARRVTTTPPGAPDLVFVDDSLRLIPLGFIFIAFVLLYVLLCRRRAVTGLLALGLIVFTCFYWLPRALLNFPAVNPLWLLLPSLALLVVLLFLAQYGHTRRNLIALAAALSALPVSLALAWLFLKHEQMQGFSSEYIRLIEYLNMSGPHPAAYDYQLFAVAGMVIYSLGVIIDATVDAVSALSKISQSLPGAGGRRPGFAPLRAVAVAMIGTLVFVSFGANLMDFFVDSLLYRDQPLLWCNTEWLNLEAGRIICGSIVFLLALLFSRFYFTLLTRNHGRAAAAVPGPVDSAN